MTDAKPTFLRDFTRNLLSSEELNIKIITFDGIHLN